MREWVKLSVFEVSPQQSLSFTGLCLTADLRLLGYSARDNKQSLHGGRQPHVEPLCSSSLPRLHVVSDSL